MAWNIVRHAFVIVFGNLNEALKASVVPFAILVAVFAGLAFVTGLTGSEIGNAAEGGLDNPLGIIIFVLVGVAVALFVFGWVAVTWHRFILLEEYPSVVPSTSGRPISAYVRRMLMIVLQLMLVMVPVMLVLGPLAGGLMANAAASFLIAIAANVLLSFIWLRVSVSLPSVAVGRPMGSVEAWKATSGVWETILMASVIVIVLNTVAVLILSFVFGGIPIVSNLLNIAVQWTSMMIGISLLTTIYGHVIEGRPLID